MKHKGGKVDLTSWCLEELRESAPSIQPLVIAALSEVVRLAFSNSETGARLQAVFEKPHEHTEDPLTIRFTVPLGTDEDPYWEESLFGMIEDAAYAFHADKSRAAGLVRVRNALQEAVGQIDELLGSIE